MAGLLRLDPDAIIDGIPEPLLASQVALGGLNADVAEKELDLLEFSAGSAASPEPLPGG